jgi:hypothetical protein
MIGGHMNYTEVMRLLDLMEKQIADIQATNEKMRQILEGPEAVWSQEAEDAYRDRHAS